MLYRVKDLSPEQRHAAEILLGQPVSDDETVSIKRLDSAMIIPSALAPEERIAAMRALDERFAARQVPEVSLDEEEALVAEAFRAVRDEPRPTT